ncbi:substance-K receptor-like isoform X1 [Penaeus chinensis]|uniref:substance-K receptor-like isoform X1 n=1 Tax=Penaeus chinensis TaxID=139456 RepID=UPI001FB7C466|nr:substance-K receptor-like isoform X1 [Penaeus chinensis]
MMAFSSPQLPTSTMASSFAANATAEISAAAAIAATASATGDLLFNTTLAPNDYGNFTGQEGQEGMVFKCNLNILQANFTEFDYDGRVEMFIPITWREVLKIVAYVIVFLVSLTGNMLVILVVFCNSHMRTSTNQYLVNLAFADLLVTMGSMWVHLMRHLSFPNFTLPSITCKLEGFIQATALLGSVFTLTVISVGRFVAVMFPFLARTSPDRALKVIAGVWVVSASIASPILVYRNTYNIQWKNFTTWHCDEFWPNHGTQDASGQCVIKFTSKMIYYTVLNTAFFFVPIAIMLVNYSMVVWRLWMTQLPGETYDPAVSASTRAKKRVVKMISVVLLVFALCWSPLQSLMLYSNFAHSQNENGMLPKWFPEAEFVSYFVAYSNSALNPIIYCGFNANFRQGLMTLLTCRQSSFTRMYHYRPGTWRGLTARTQETTVGNSGNEHAVVVDLNSTGRKRISHRGPQQPGGISITSSCTELRQNNIGDLTAESCRRCNHNEGSESNLETHLGHSCAPPATIYNNHALHHELHHSHSRLHQSGEHLHQGQNGRRLPLVPSCDSSHDGEGVGCGCCRRQKAKGPSVFHQDVE